MDPDPLTFVLRTCEGMMMTFGSAEADFPFALTLTAVFLGLAGLLQEAVQMMQ